MQDRDIIWKKFPVFLTSFIVLFWISCDISLEKKKYLQH